MLAEHRRLIPSAAMPEPTTETAGIKRYLPRIGSLGYHLLLATVAILILGPLGSVSAALMNFPIGFFIAGQEFAGILSSAVKLTYQPDRQARRKLHANDCGVRCRHGRHGRANAGNGLAGPAGIAGVDVDFVLSEHRHVWRRPRRRDALYADARALDAMLLSSSYASSFDGFAELPTIWWWA